MKFQSSILLVLMIVLPSATSAQLYDVDSNQNPPDIQWKQIKTPHYQIIFPEEITSEAQRVANTIEYVYGPIAKTLKTCPDPIPLVLTSRSVISNAHVQLAPRKTEWWSTPPQSSLLGTADWYNLLASHELRHVAQFSKLNSGFTRLAGILWGDYGRSVFTFVSVPSWFFEGDAVGTETALSNSGRGRMPEFDMEIRAILLSGKKPSYYKAYLRSFKDWYPNHYHLGYLLATEVKREYGADVWSNVLVRTSLQTRKNLLPLWIRKQPVHFKQKFLHPA